MKDTMIYIPFCGKVLAIDQETFQVALKNGEELMGSFPNSGPGSSSGDQKLLDAKGAAELTKVPESWFLEAARREEIPHVRLGKYVRFKLKDVLEALEKRPRTHG